MEVVDWQRLLIAIALIGIDQERKSHWQFRW